MDERILDHLKRLNKYYLHLLDLKKMSAVTFEKDDIKRAAGERYLQLAIESCLNIGNRILSLYQFNQPVNTPETYADIFVELQRLGFVDSDFSKRLIQMAKFRNRLVHLYWELDNETVYKIIQENVEDFKLFQEKIVQKLKDNSK
jgi:uncharacterized protein YutE (UPF0331/DUF86 family)